MVSLIMTIEAIWIESLRVLVKVTLIACLYTLGIRSELIQNVKTCNLFKNLCFVPMLSCS